MITSTPETPETPVSPLSGMVTGVARSESTGPAAAPGLVTFRLGPRSYATSLVGVREVVRLVGLTGLDGMTPPLAGVIDLRGTCLPVLDLRHTRGEDTGDVLVLLPPDGDPVGVAVDQVQAVVDADDLPEASGGAGVLPAYVLGVLRGPEGPVFRVDLHHMALLAGDPVATRPVPTRPVAALPAQPLPATMVFS